MLDSKLFLNAIAQLQEEKNIPVETMKEALEEAFIKTYRREFDPEAELRVEIDMEEGEIKLIHIKNIVENVEDELTEISLTKAQEINPEYKSGDQYEKEVEFTQEFSSLAALQVKQIIRQKVREKEKELILTEYVEKIGDIIEGNVETVKENFYIIAFDKTFGFLNKSQVPKGVSFGPGDKVRAAIINVDKTSKGVPIILSMTSAEVVKRIIEKEIPEVIDGTIIIDKIARYAGIRTKMIVKSNEAGVDPVGTIIGENGTRIQRIISEVGREFIDVIPFIEDKEQQIARAMTPAKCRFVKIIKNEDEAAKDKALVVVSDLDFSAAIGRGGSNAKVVSRLLDIEIEVKRESEVDFEIPTISYEKPKPQRTFRKSNDINLDDFKIEEDDFDDALFDKPKPTKEKATKTKNNFNFEEFADVPEIDDFEGFADDEDNTFAEIPIIEEEDELFAEENDQIAGEEINLDDFDKYYED